MALRVWDGSTSGDYGTDTNWSGDTVPGKNDTASFGAVSRKALSVVSTFLVQEWTLNDGLYSFAIAANKAVFFFGAGITGVGAETCTVNLASGAVVSFLNSAGADNILFSGAGRVNFANTSSASTAVFANVGDVFFSDQSSASNAQFLQNVSSTEIHFQDSSTAGTATFGGTNCRIIFEGNSSAADAGVFDSSVTFRGHATGGNARFVRSGVMSFEGNSSPGNAAFQGDEDIKLFDSTGPNGDHRLTMGSLLGAGTVFLGSNELTIGGNNRTTLHSGSFVDGGGHQGGSIVKVGTGTLTLTGTSIHTGGTTVNNGALQVDGFITNGNVVVNSGGTLSGIGKVNGATTVNSAGRIAPGKDSVHFPNEAKGALKTGALTLNSGSSLVLEIGGIAAGTQHDLVVVTGAVAIGNATLSATLTNGFLPSLMARQTFLLIENDGTDSVTGQFAGLAEDTTFAMGNRLFTVTYKGGTGNDVVLTSEGALIVGTAAADTISKSKAPTGQLTASILNDKVLGLRGSDKIKTSDGNDTVQGGKGKDTIDGGRGSDTADYSDKSKSVSVTLNGSHDVTVKVAGKAEDVIRNVENLIGGSKADSFTGDSKANRFDGGLGRDLFKGLGGKDIFVFSVTPGKSNADTILDFKHDTDTIGLDDSIFAGTGPSLGKGEFYAKAGAHAAHDANDRIIYDKTSGKLYYDADGNLGPDTAHVFAILITKPALSVGDFDIV